MNKSVSVLFLIITVVFCTCLLLSNILEVKLVRLFGVTLTAGVLVFPITYLLNDVVAEIWGFRKARLIIWLGFLMNFFSVGLFLFSVWLPYPSFWDGQEAYAKVLGFTPRIAIASLIAFTVGSYLNALVMSKMRIRHKERYFSLRAIVSTLVGESFDSIVFFAIAFFNVVPLQELFWMMLTQALLKTGYEVLLLPVTIRIVRRLKQIEPSVDDEGVSYNLFKVRDL
ncbi:MAG: queuosine precursor transporter [Bacteroidales bacterium]|nr:queuosine precursor transporter [Bacteroidales bacterium]